MKTIKKLIIVAICALMGVSDVAAAYRPRNGRRTSARRQITRRSPVAFRVRPAVVARHYGVRRASHAQVPFRALKRHVRVVPRSMSRTKNSAVHRKAHPRVLPVSKPVTPRPAPRQPATVLQCSICRQQCTPQRPNIIKYPCRNSSVIHPVCDPCLERAQYQYNNHCPVCGEYYSTDIKWGFPARPE